MKKYDDPFYLEGIEEHIAAIKKYLPDSKQAYIADEILQDAILMRLLAIGEEAAHLSDVLILKYPGVEFHKIIGLRNRIVHGYFEVDKDIIWETLTDSSLDRLLEVVEKEK